MTTAQTLTTGTLTITATALDPIHHGAGSVGNVQILRTQPIIGPDGAEYRVPFISGNSIKHLIRDGGTHFAIEALGVEPGSLTKGMVDLLWSGGGLTKGGSAVNIAKARELERLFPLLAVCGYGAGNTMTSSKLRVDHLHMVCAENAWRMPLELTETPHAAMLAGEMTSEDFGTRHDALRDPVPNRLLDVERRTLIEVDKAAKSTGKTATDKSTDSAQMIYSFETINAGARFYGAIHFRGLSDLEIGALQSALGRACVGMHGDAHVFHVGAKSAVGFGRLAVRFGGVLRHVQRPVHSESADLARIGDAAPAVATYLEHIRANRQEILTALREAAE